MKYLALLVKMTGEKVLVLRKHQLFSEERNNSLYIAKFIKKLQVKSVFISLMGKREIKCIQSYRRSKRG